MVGVVGSSPIAPTKLPRRLHYFGVSEKAALGGFFVDVWLNYDVTQHVPLSISLCTSIPPPCLFTMPYESDSPRAVALPTGLVVKTDQRCGFMFSGKIPEPVWLMAISSIRLNNLCE